MDGSSDSSCSGSGQVASFFWDGPSMPAWSRACLNSFSTCGFEVDVYTYSGDLEGEWSGSGISIRDAADVCDPAFRKRLFRAAKPGTYGETYACFTDFFRLKLLSDLPGAWWFDTDVFCLRPAREFHRLLGRSSGRALCGYQTPVGSPKMIACNAILNLGDAAFAKRLHQNLLSDYPPFKSHKWRWAKTAIPFLNSMIERYPEDFCVESWEVFYPISWQLEELALLSLPENLEVARSRCERAYTLHFWNEVFSREGISRDTLPPAGSLLHELVTKNMPGGLACDVLTREEVKAKLEGSE